MIPVALLQAGHSTPPPFAAFGGAADQVNMLKPNKVAYATTSLVQTDIAANNVNQWIIGDSTQDAPSGGGAGTPYCTLGAMAIAPDGNNTAQLLVEANSNTPPVFAAKPAPWTLTGFDSKWNDLWNNAIAVVPCWEGSGTPVIYTTNGVVSSNTMSLIGSAGWTTFIGDGQPCLTMPTSADDWQIPAVAGTDIVPTTQFTMLVVRRRLAATSGSNCYGIGIRGGGTPNSAEIFNFAGNNLIGSLGASNGIGVETVPSTTDYEMIAVSASSSGITVYQRLGSSFAQGVNLGSGGAGASRTAGNFPFSLSTCIAATSNLGVDVTFLAVLSVAWTSTQIITWMNDPYAPIRPGGGGSRVLYSGIPTPHDVHAGLDQIINYWFNQHRYKLAVWAKAGTRSRFWLEIASGVTLAIKSRQVGVKALFDLASGTVVSAPAAFGSGNYGGGHYTPLIPVAWTPGPATMTQLGTTGWYLCTLEVTTADMSAQLISNASVTQGTLLCTISLDMGTGTNPGVPVYGGNGTSGIYFWQSRLLPAAAFDLTHLIFSDGFDDASTIDANDTKAAGFNWYSDTWWPGFYPRTDPTWFRMVPADWNLSSSVLTINMNHWAGNAAFGTCCYNGLSGFIGRTFTFPGLFEANVKWAAYTSATTECPAFWLMSMYLALQGNIQDWNVNIGSNWQLVTAGTASAGTNVLNFTTYVPTFVKIGSKVFNHAAIPNNTTVTAITRGVAGVTPGSITLSNNILAGGVPSGTTIKFETFGEYDLFEVKTASSAQLYPFASMFGNPGGTEQQVDCGIDHSTSTYGTFHKLQTLVLPHTVTDNGISIQFVDGRVAPSNNFAIMEWGISFVPPGFGTPIGGLTIADGDSYVLFISGGTTTGVWPALYDAVKVWGP